MWLVISGLGGALITGFVTIAVARYSKSGRVNTSEAKDLWDTLRGELLRLQTETSNLRAEITVARQELVALRDDASRARSRASELQSALQACGFQVTRLRTMLRDLGGDPGPAPEIGPANGS